jgi:predicted transcriptional regulator
MAQHGQTKDERFMIALYEHGLKLGDTKTPANKYEIGKTVGMQNTAVYTIVRDLLQANFLKKGSDDDVFLTDHGEKLVKNLLGLY